MTSDELRQSMIQQSVDEPIALKEEAFNLCLENVIKLITEVIPGMLVNLKESHDEYLKNERKERMDAVEEKLARLTEDQVFDLKKACDIVKDTSKPSSTFYH